jgi:hypothetical protein
MLMLLMLLMLLLLLRCRGCCAVAVVSSGEDYGRRRCWSSRSSL